VFASKFRTRTNPLGTYVSVSVAHQTAHITLYVPSPIRWLAWTYAGYVRLLHQGVSSTPRKGRYLSGVAGGVHLQLPEGAGGIFSLPPLGCVCTMYFVQPYPHHTYRSGMPVAVLVFSCSGILGADLREGGFDVGMGWGRGEQVLGKRRHMSRSICVRQYGVYKSGLSNLS
jgi:hypothetical protein